jgi:GntR family transcriptional regulator
LLADDGAEHPHVSKLLECRRLRASAEIARQLELKPADPVVLIRRLLQFDGESTVLDEIWLPGNVFRGLTAERLAEYKGPLYAMFEADFGTRMIRATEKIRAVAAEPMVADLLNIPAGFPLLSVDRVSYTYGDRPVEVRRGWYVTTGYYSQTDWRCRSARPREWGEHFPVRRHLARAAAVPEADFAAARYEKALKLRISVNT